MAPKPLPHALMTIPEWLSTGAKGVKSSLNTLRPRQNGRYFADDIFKCIFLNENAWISPRISLKFVPAGPTNNIPALVQIMAWHCPGDKPLSEPMMVSSLTDICVTRPQLVNTWLQWIGQRQLQDDTRNIAVLEFGAAYIRGLTVFIIYSCYSATLFQFHVSSTTGNIMLAETTKWKPIGKQACI